MIPHIIYEKTKAQRDQGLCPVTLQGVAETTLFSLVFLPSLQLFTQFHISGEQQPLSIRKITFNHDSYKMSEKT